MREDKTITKMTSKIIKRDLFKDEDFIGRLVGISGEAGGFGREFISSISLSSYNKLCLSNDYLSGSHDQAVLLRFYLIKEKCIICLPKSMVNLKEAVAQKLEPVNTFLDHNPEREYLTGAALWIVYTLALVNPDLFPSQVVQALEFFRHLDPSNYEPILIGSAATGAALTVDGARRIAFNRVPFVKAYLFYLKEDLKNKLRK